MTQLPALGCNRAGICERNDLGSLEGRGAGSGFGEYAVLMERLNWGRSNPSAFVKVLEQPSCLNMGEKVAISVEVERDGRLRDCDRILVRPQFSQAEVDPVRQNSAKPQIACLGLTKSAISGGIFVQTINSSQLSD